MRDSQFRFAHSAPNPLPYPLPVFKGRGGSRVFRLRITAPLNSSHCTSCFGTRWRFFFLWDKREPRRDRMMALQPNKKIKDPHAPANGEAVTDISAKHCVHCWRKLSTLRGAKNTSMNSFVYHASTKRR